MTIRFNERENVEEEIITCEISDESLELAAMAVKEIGGVQTLAFCSGLDTCPA
jgi:hypothetical protein